MHPITEKRCSKCGLVKSLTEFFARKSGSRDGHMSSCKACKTAAIMEWRKANREQWNAYCAERSRAPEEVKRRAKYVQRPEVKMRNLERERSAQVKAMRKKWREENKEKLRHYYIDKNHKRRAKTKTGVTKTEWLGICAKYRNRCVYCGAKAKLTMDHEIPLATGGAHEPSNIVPACLPCNSSKRAMHPVEFAQEKLGRLL